MVPTVKYILNRMKLLTLVYFDEIIYPAWFLLVNMFMEVITLVIITHRQTIGRDMKTIPLVLCYTAR